MLTDSCETLELVTLRSLGSTMKSTFEQLGPAVLHTQYQNSSLPKIRPCISASLQSSFQFDSSKMLECTPLMQLKL